MNAFCIRLYPDLLGIDNITVVHNSAIKIKVYKTDLNYEINNSNYKLFHVELTYLGKTIEVKCFFQNPYKIILLFAGFYYHYEQKEFGELCDSLMDKSQFDSLYSQYLPSKFTQSLTNRTIAYRN